jgi:hypothetical protein
LLIGLALCSSVETAWGKPQVATFELAVPAESWKGVRVQDIPKGTQLGIDVVSDGNVEVLLLDADEYARFPSETGAVFRGRVVDHLSTTVLAPRSGDYYVLLDNRTGAEPRSVEVEIQAEKPEGGTLSADAGAKLSRFGDFLASMLQFAPFPVDMTQCANARSFADTAGVALCREYASALHQAFRDAQKSEDALVFALLHRFGHELLAQWGHPDHAVETTVDDFSLALLRLTSSEDRFREQLLFLTANAPVFERIAAGFGGDSHSLSGDRARHLREASRDPDLMRRWQRILVPHMQTRVLQELRHTPTRWADTALVERELAQRR